MHSIFSGTLKAESLYNYTIHPFQKYYMGNMVDICLITRL